MVASSAINNQSFLATGVDPYQIDLLTFAGWVIFDDFLSSPDMFLTLLLSTYSFRNNSRVSNSFDTGQARRSVRPDLDPNCLQRLSADGKIRC